MSAAAAGAGGGAAASSEFQGPAATLSSACSRALSDRSYDKRKSGALEVEAVVKALVAEQRRVQTSSVSLLQASQPSPLAEGVNKIVRRLANDFVVSANPHQRKGGLIGIAAVAIGLGTDVGAFLDLLLPPVLKCMDDPEARVRYYAAEALFNVIKVARGAVLVKAAHFNAVFHGLCKAFADSDAEVKNGAALLDRLLKDVVAECAGGFDIAGVIPLFHEYFKVKNPFIRQLLISWVSALDAVPDLDMASKTPMLLEGLLDMLADGNKSIRDGAELVLQNLKDQILKKPAEYVSEIQKCVDILVHRQGAGDTASTRLLILVWVRDFLASPVGEASLVDRLADLLGLVVRGFGDDGGDGAEIRDGARRVDVELRRVASGEQGVRMLEGPILENTCLAHLSSEHRSVRELMLEWISLLLDVLPTTRTLPFMDVVVPRLMDTLRADPLDEVVILALHALARFVHISSDFDGILASVYVHFGNDRDLLERRGALVVRQLCVLLRPTVVYLVLAKTVAADAPHNVEFASLFVHALNVILLTAPELNETRTSLRRAWIGAAAEFRGRKTVGTRTPRTPAAPASSSTSSSVSVTEQQQQQHPPMDDDLDTFNALFQAWCHNPISCLSLCLLGGAYGLGAGMVEYLGMDVEPTVGMLVDADRLVRLLETPAFLHVRMQLLRSGNEFEPDLLKTLYGLLMLLPQKSEAYGVLHARLSSVTNMHIALGSRPEGGGGEGGGNGGGAGVEGSSRRRVQSLQARFDALLVEFQKVQMAHGKAREERDRDKSL